MLRRILSILLAAAAAGLPLFTQPAYAEGEVISLSAPQDIVRLAEACVYDGYSRGRTVALMNDIDLSGTDCPSIEVFCGTFEGGGHTLRGITLSFQDSGKGFFGTVAEEGTVRDLTVEVQITAARREEGTSSSGFWNNLFKNLGGLDKLDDQESLVTLGGLAGTNNGLITNCTVTGSVQGEEQVGGLAGLNTGSGRIEYSTNEAKLKGTSSVGGIAGKNEGSVKVCVNNGGICTDSDGDTRCAGGIAGVSQGLVHGCTNSGDVGYKGFGNNMGGIAGKQNGCITECINTGSVSGGKGVGGIAGRFDPYTNLDISYEAVKQNAQDQLNTVKNDVETAKNKIYDYADQLVSEVTDFSGIAGKLFPGISGLSGTADSGRNLLDRAAEAAAAAAGALDHTGGAMDEIGDAAQGAKDAVQGIQDSLDRTAVDVSGEVRDNLRDTSASLRNTLDTVQSSADKFSGISGEITELIDELTDSVTEGRSDQQDLVERLNGKLDELDGDVLDPMIEGLEETRKNIQRTLNSIRRDVSDVSDALIDPLEKLDKVLDALTQQAASIKNDIEKLSGKLQELVDKISQNLPELPHVPSLSEEKAGTPPLTGWLGMTAVYAESVNATQEEIRERLNRVVSSDMPLPRIVAGEVTDTALIRYSSNEGEVEGNEAAGGVVGVMGIESAVKSGDNLTLPDGEVVGSGSVVKAAVESCISQGGITAKNQSAGGIAGQADLGTLRRCLATGRIEITEGGFGGGIAGSSAADIDCCAAIADVYGKSDLGGIAGQGADLRQCYALPRLSAGADRIGGIAGGVTGEAAQNYFIDEGLAGINGADYVGSAEARSPQDMTGTSSIPPGMGGFSEADWYMGGDDVYLPQIRSLSENEAEVVGAYLSGKSADLARFHFSAAFQADGETLKVIPMEYGERVQTADIPRPQSKDGFVPSWDPDVTQPVVRHTVFHAVYNKATATIATNEDPPLMLVEGNFSDGARLTAERTEISQEFDGYEKQSAYAFSITPEQDAGVLRVHIRDTEDRPAAIGIVPNGSAQVLECQRDGSYLVFELDRPQAFVILYQPSRAPLVLGVCGGAALLLAGGGGLWLWKRKKSGALCFRPGGKKNGKPLPKNSGMPEKDPAPEPGFGTEPEKEAASYDGN